MWELKKPFEDLKCLIVNYVTSNAVNGVEGVDRHTLWQKQNIEAYAMACTT